MLSNLRTVEFGFGLVVIFVVLVLWLPPDVKFYGLVEVNDFSNQLLCGEYKVSLGLWVLRLVKLCMNLLNGIGAKL